MAPSPQLLPVRRRGLFLGTSKLYRPKTKDRDRFWGSPPVDRTSEAIRSAPEREGGGDVHTVHLLKPMKVNRMAMFLPEIHEFSEIR